MTLPLVALVEDDPAIVAVLTDLLVSEGFRTFSWRQGAGAHAIIQREQPSAIILDIRMETDRAGEAVLASLRDDPATADIPVIVCTADAQFVSDHGARLQQQAHYAVIQKPFLLDYLLDTMRTLIDPAHRDSARAARAPRIAPPATPAPIAADPTLPPLVALIVNEGRGVANRIDLLREHGYRIVAWQWGNGIHQLIARERPAVAVFDIEPAERFAASFTLNRLRHDPTTRAVRCVICSSDPHVVERYATKYPIVAKDIDAPALFAAVRMLAPPPILDIPVPRRGRPRKNLLPRD